MTKKNNRRYEIIKKYQEERIKKTLEEEAERVHAAVKKNNEQMMEMAKKLIGDKHSIKKFYQDNSVGSRVTIADKLYELEGFLKEKLKELPEEDDEWHGYNMALQDIQDWIEENFEGNFKDKLLKAEPIKPKRKPSIPPNHPTGFKIKDYRYAKRKGLNHD